MDFQVIANNFAFLMLQGFLGFGAFAGGTLRLAIPAIVLGFILGTAIGLARLARARWLYLAAAAYVEFFRGVPLVMVMSPLELMQRSTSLAPGILRSRS